MTLQHGSQNAYQPTWCQILLIHYIRSGNLFTITGGMNCTLSLEGRKIIWFYPKMLSLSNYEEDWLLLTYYPSTCSTWIFALTHCCTLTWVTTILLRTISNVHAGRGFPSLHCTVDWSNVGSLLVFDSSPYITSKNLDGVWWMTVGKHMAVVSCELL